MERILQSWVISNSQSEALMTSVLKRGGSKGHQTARAVCVSAVFPGSLGSVKWVGCVGSEPGQARSNKTAGSVALKQTMKNLKTIPVLGHLSALAGHSPICHEHLVLFSNTHTQNFLLAADRHAVLCL